MEYGYGILRCLRLYHSLLLLVAIPLLPQIKAGPVHQIDTLFCFSPIWSDETRQMLQASLLLRIATCTRPLYSTTRTYASISCTTSAGPFYRVVALTFAFDF